MRRAGILAMAALVAAGACGKSSEEKKEEKKEQQAAKTAETGAAEAAKGLEQMAKGLQAMAGGAAAGTVQPAEPVSFRDMQALFPEFQGWQKGKPTGERMSAPFKYSQAEVEYTKGDSRVELKMIDSGFNQLLLTPYAMFLTAGYEKETSDGYEKSTKVNGQPGWEKWDSSGKDGELNALVGKRFLVQINGRRIEDTKLLHELAGKIDMAKLSTLK